jgi:hypothetical protein
MAICFFSVVCTQQAQEPTPSPTPISYADESANHQVPADQGQIIILNADGGLVTTAEELDAIRLEIITLRRFVTIIGGIFLGWNMIAYLFRVVQ